MSNIRKDVAELFEAASFTIEDCDDGEEQFQDIAKQMEDILDGLMTHLSATMGLSYKRVNLYEKQKKSLITDLKKMKEERANARQTE
jgi:hypothetical protein